MSRKEAPRGSGRKPGFRAASAASSALLAAAIAAALPAAAGAAEPIAAVIDRELPALLRLYEHLHAHPELSFQEAKTAARIAEELRPLGFEVASGVGGHGVVAVLRNGGGPTVLLRADLDALPITERTGLPYASRARATDDRGVEVDVMHACGHDVHMTVLVGAARLLSRLRDRWRGTLVLVGQPAEERGAGARAMLADGLFKRFPRPDAAVAFHVKPDLPAGSVGHVEGYALANVDSVDLTIRGVGSHGAWPHLAKDPIVLASQTVLALQTIVSRELAPGEPAVVTVGSIQGGAKHNIIPDEVRLQLTLRSYSEEVRARTIAAIERIARGLAEAAGVPEDRMPVVAVLDESTPATYNDPALTGRLAKALRAALGEARVRPVDPVMGGEDFSQFGRTPERVPISLLWLGAADPEALAQAAKTGKPVPPLHSGAFAPPPGPTIRTGVEAAVAVVLELAGPK